MFSRRQFACFVKKIVILLFWLLSLKPNACIIHIIGIHSINAKHKIFIFSLIMQKWTIYFNMSKLCHVNVKMCEIAEDHTWADLNHFVKVVPMFEYLNSCVYVRTLLCTSDDVSIYFCLINNIKYLIMSEKRPFLLLIHTEMQWSYMMGLKNMSSFFADISFLIPETKTSKFLNGVCMCNALNPTLVEIF